MPILLIVQQLNPAVVFKADRAAFDGVEHLGGMKAEHGSVSKARRGNAFILYCKGMRGVIDDLQAVFFCNSVDGLHVAEIAVYVHRHNRRRPICNEALYFGHVNGVVLLVYIAEHRHQTVPNDRMRGRGKSKRRGNHFAAIRQIQRRDGVFQRQMTVRIERHMRDSQIVFQFGL